MFKPGHTTFDHVKTGWEKNKKTILVTAAVVLVLAGAATGGMVAYASSYDGRIYPNVYINGVNVGGMTVVEAKDTLQATFNDMLENGLTIELNGETAVIDLRNSGATDPDLVYDLMDFDADAAADAAFRVARSDRFSFDQAWSAWLLVDPERYTFPVTVLNEQIVDGVYDAFGDQEVEGVAADFTIENTRDAWEIDFVDASPGEKLNVDPDLESVSDDALDFSLEPLTLSIETEDDMITASEALALEEEVVQIIEAAPYTLAHTSPAEREYSWSISEDDMIDWIRPVRDSETSLVEIGLDPDALEIFFEELHDVIDIKPQNARFLIEDGKVEEFKGSLDGTTLDEEQTLVMLMEQLGEENVEFDVAVSVVEPEITTGSVNDLGIKEIIGVGVSDFSGSPANRISNIRHGADKLNGLLIAPDETFSLVEALSPFTISDGWLPELVIKGDEIKPEVGGGACQFGTTLFRAVMDSGMEVVERRNHSLIVNYYADLRNGNPGGDATIYDPAPDFKWKNDTPNYVLLTTDVNTSTGEMVFTFWGTDDGREAVYTPPVVLSWTGYGETQYTETTDLAPGVTKCQAPHSGATTSFDYTVEYADGTSFEKTFTSTYRSLPRICLVGIDPDAPPEGEVEAGEGDAPAEEPADLPPAEPNAEELEVEDVDVEIIEE